MVEISEIKEFLSKKKGEKSKENNIFVGLRWVRTD